MLTGYIVMVVFKCQKGEILLKTDVWTCSSKTTCCMNSKARLSSPPRVGIISVSAYLRFFDSGSAVRDVLTSDWKMSILVDVGS